MATTIASPFDSSSRSSQRVHSAQLIQNFSQWSSLLDPNETEPAKSALTKLHELVLSAAAEAAYLGFPRCSRLSRVLHAAIQKQMSRGVSPDAAQRESLHQSFQSLATLLSSPQHEGVDIAELVQSLRLRFELTEGELCAPLANLSADEPAHQATALELAGHRDLDVYLSARLDTLDRCSEEETWIVAQLASLAEDLASGMQSAHPAQRLMRVLRSHKFFHQIDRVCLAGRVPNANQLMVVDAATSERCSTNTLKPGYSCFVNPEGSLFTLRPGTMRIFDDSDRVLGTFAAAGRPAQRSIALIDDMGLRSGLCLAIGRESELQGFLFLNSCQPELFRDITVSFSPLISLLGLVATIALDSNGFHKSCGRFGNLDGDLPKASILFHPNEFKLFVERAVLRRIGPNTRFNIEVQCIEDSSQPLADFLYLPAQVAGILGELIMRLQLIGPANTSLTVVIQQKDDTVQITVPHRAVTSNTKQWEWMRGQVDYLINFIGNTPLKLVVGEEDVALTFPFEPVLQSHREIRYSVVY